LLLSLLTMPATVAKVKMMTSATATPSKELTKHIIHVVVASTSAASLLLLSDSLFAADIVGPAFVGIAESLVRIGKLLEMSLRFVRIILVLVWVVFDCHLFKRFLYLSISSISFDSEQFVIVL